MTDSWAAVTSLGDSALLLPLMGWTGLCLLLSRDDRPLGVRWVAAAAVCGGVVALSKLLFMAWGVGSGLPGLDYTGFSGHTALSLLTWPALAALLARRARPWLRASVIGIGLLIGGAVAFSRLALKAHSVSEVVLGAVLALLVVGWFLQGLLRDARRQDVDAAASDTDATGTAERRTMKRRLCLAVGAVVIAVCCYGAVFPSQHVLTDLALWLSGRTEVFARHSPAG